MANNYNVDDILAEVRKKKQTADPDPVLAERSAGPHRSTTESAAAPGWQNASRPGAPLSAAPFKMSGMTDEFEPPHEPPPAAQTRSEAGNAKTSARRIWEEDDGELSPPPRGNSAAGGFTRMDLPVRPISGAKDDIGATRIMPTVCDQSTDAQALDARRQEKVRQFMQTSFASLDDEDFPEEEPPSAPIEDDGLNSISQFFGGLSHGGGTSKGKHAHHESDTASASPKSKKGRRNEAPPLPFHSSDEDDDFADGEYTTPADAPDIEKDIRAIKRGLGIRVIVTALCFVGLLYLALCNLYPLPLLRALCPEVNMQLYLIVNLAVLLIAALFSNSVIGGGLISLFTLKADHDSPCALATLAVIAQGVAAIVVKDFVHTGDSNFYFSVAALGLLFNAIGKRIMILRIERNFAIASNDTPHNGQYVLRETPLAQELAEGQDLDDPVIAYSAPIEFPEDFLKLSYSDDYSESISRIIAPLFLLFSLALAFMSYFAFNQSPMTSLTIFCAVLCMASPLTPTLIGNVPLMRAANKLAGSGALISGYDAVDTFEDVNAVILDAADLYPASSVVLHGIKAFAEDRIDEAILDAASVMRAGDGLLKDLFLEIIGHKTAILKPVDALCYEDGMGLCAEVDGKPVMIGNRALMDSHGIELPSREYEKKFLKSGRELLYLANSGEATAMFVLSYQANAEVSVELDALARQGIGLLLHSTDPNISRTRIAADYHYPEEFIRILPANCHKKYNRLTRPLERGKAYAISAFGTSAHLRMLSIFHPLKQAIVTGTILQLASLILGYALIAFLSFTGSISSMGFLQLLIYQVFWTLAITLLPNLKKL